MTWNQIYDPFGSWPLSTAVSALPVFTLFFVPCVYAIIYTRRAASQRSTA